MRKFKKKGLDIVKRITHPESIFTHFFFYSLNSLLLCNFFFRVMNKFTDVNHTTVRGQCQDNNMPEPKLMNETKKTV